MVACSSAAPDRLRRRIQYSRNLVQHTLPHKVTIHTEAPSRHTYGMISNRPLSRITPQMSFHQRQEMLSWPFVSWAMKAHHHGPELGKLCLRVSSEITIEVILCKYSRRSYMPPIGATSQCRLQGLVFPEWIIHLVVVHRGSHNSSRSMCYKVGPICISVIAPQQAMLIS